MICSPFWVVLLWKSCENLALFSLLGVSPFSNCFVLSHSPIQAIQEQGDKQAAFPSWSTDNSFPGVPCAMGEYKGCSLWLLFRDQDCKNGMGRRWAMAQSSSKPPEWGWHSKGSNGWGYLPPCMSARNSTAWNHNLFSGFLFFFWVQGSSASPILTVWLKSHNLAFHIFDGCLKNTHAAFAVLSLFHFSLSPGFYFDNVIFSGGVFPPVANALVCTVANGLSAF